MKNFRRGGVTARIFKKQISNQVARPVPWRRISKIRKSFMSVVYKRGEGGGDKGRRSNRMASHAAYGGGERN